MVRQNRTRRPALVSAAVHPEDSSHWPNHRSNNPRAELARTASERVAFNDWLPRLERLSPAAKGFY